VTKPRSASAGGPERFFERFRAAAARLPAGLIRVMPPATAEDVATAEAALGRRLPEDYASFLRSFDGADLFHESVLVAGVGRSAPRALVDLCQDHAGELVFAESQNGDRYGLDGRGRVVRHDEGAEERAVAGTSFSRWLDATVAREQLLYGPDGEYAPDLFDPSGEELLPRVALRQAERALKADPDAPDAEHARGLALVRLGDREGALAALHRATALDPENPWPWFDLGRTALDLGRPAEALAAFRRAADGEPGPSGGRLLAWAARAAVAAGDAPEAAALRDLALGRDAGLPEGLERSAREAVAEGDVPGGREALALLAAIDPGRARLPALARLPVIESTSRPPATGSDGKAVSAPRRAASEPPSRPPPPARPRRRGPGARPQSGGSRRGSRR
jgi:tetratricopeptide (TPR) repeat protein